MEQLIAFVSANWLWLLVTIVIGFLLGWLLTGLPNSSGRKKEAQHAADVEKQLQTSQRKLQDTEQQLQASQRNVQEAEQQLVASQSKIADAEQRLKTMDDQVASGSTQSMAEQKQIQELQAETERLKSALQAKDDELADALAKLAGPVRLFEQVSGVGAGAVSLEHLTIAKAPAIINTILAGMRPKLVESPQDMVVIPGLGKAAEQRLYEAGIGTYWELENLTADDLTTMINLTPAQKSHFNYEQVRTTAHRLAEESQTIGAIWNARRTDDLETIPGISGVFEQRLYSAGISTFEDLAATTVEQLSDICRAPSTMMPNYGAWIAIAKDMVEKRNSAAAKAAAANQDGGA